MKIRRADFVVKVKKMKKSDIRAMILIYEQSFIVELTDAMVLL